MANDIDLGIVAQGPQGKSAYDIAVDNGFSGTQQQWLASLKGDPGMDAHAPKRGTDYWTDADKNSIIDELKKYVDSAMTGAFAKAKAEVEDAVANGKY